jgi:DNA-directed RNA polymerase subunit RPC12/RpoP
VSLATRKLELACPLCGSGEVFYTCTPGCCFNHVCGNCGATFEPETHPAGGVLRGVIPPDPLPDASDPTAACARCDSTAVYMTADNTIVCANCGTVLRIEMTEVSGGAA